MEAELEEFGFHSDAGDAEPAGSTSLVALGEFDGAGENFAFGIFENTAMDIRNFAATRGRQEFVDVMAKGGCNGHRSSGVFVHNGLKMVDGDGVALGEEESFADDVFEFAHVSRPGVALKKVHGIGMNGRFRSAEFGSVLLQEETNDGRNVFAAIAQRGKVDDDDAEAIVKVFAKLLLANGVFEVAIGGSKNADINGDGFFAANSLEGFFLQDAHEFDLGANGHVADFIEEDGATIGLLEAADAAFGSAGECAAFVTEEFAFQKRFRNGSAINGDERGIRAVTVLENGAGDEFFAGPGFAADEDVDGLGSDAANIFVDALHGRALADEGIASGSGFAE